MSWEGHSHVTFAELERRPIVKVMLDQGAFMPERAHSTDAGADLRTPVDFTIGPGGSATIDIGVHIQLPPFTKCEIKPKSGLNVKCGIIADGLIDEGYTGSIVVKLYNLSENEYHFERGDKITQIVISPVYYPSFVEVEEIGGGERGDGGFGSTGR